MLGPFATASRRTPPVLILHCHSPGVATVARRLRTDVHNNDNNDNALQRGPLWPHRMGPTTMAASSQASCQLKDYTAYFPPAHSSSQLFTYLALCDLRYEAP